MQKWLLLLVIVSASCDIFSRPNPVYCADSSACTNGQTCNLGLHLCQSSAAPFTLTSVSPSTAPPAGGITVTLTGTGFSNNMSVLFNGTAATNVTTVSPTQLTATVPPRLSDCGLATITLSDSRGSLQNSQLFRFRLTTIAFTRLPNPPGVNSTATSLTALRADNNQAYDLAVGDPSGSGNIGVYLGNGDMTFASPIPNTSVGTVQEDHLVPANLDGNSSVDLLAYSIAGPTPGISFLLNDGTGRFTSQGAYTAGAPQPFSVVAAPFMEANFSNVLYIEGKDSSPYLLVYNSPADYAGSPNTVIKVNISFTAASLVTGDFNKDGIPDFAAIDHLAGMLHVYLGKGTGTFAEGPSSPYPITQAATPLTTGDFNNDGILDLLIPFTKAGAATTVALGQADGSFRIKSTMAIPAALIATKLVTTADVDCDGQSDVIISSGDGAIVSVFVTDFGNDMVTFTDKADFNISSTPASAIAVAPFSSTNAGKSDLVILGVAPGAPSTAGLIMYRNDSH